MHTADYGPVEMRSQDASAYVEQISDMKKEFSDFMSVLKEQLGIGAETKK